MSFKPDMRLSESVAIPFDVTFGTVTMSDGRIVKYTVEDPPWEPKIGDTVWYKTKSGATAGWNGVTLIAVHGDGRLIDDLIRKWAVVAYQGDIPRVIEFRDLLKERS